MNGGPAIEDDRVPWHPTYTLRKRLSPYTIRADDVPQKVAALILFSAIDEVSDFVGGSTLLDAVRFGIIVASHYTADTALPHGRRCRPVHPEMACRDGFHTPSR